MLNESNNNIIYLSEPESVSMDDDWFENTDRYNFWMRWKFEVLKSHLTKHFEGKPEILEIGCGNGINLQMLASDMGIIADGCDLNKTALDQIESVKGKKYLYNILKPHPQLTGKYDFVLLLDVLEHIKDDLEFLKASVSHLKKGGRVMINVPAHKFLYSKYDKQIGHKRRYSRKELIALIEKAGLHPELVQYWGFFLVPLLVIRKIVMFFKKDKIVSTGFRPPNAFINNAFVFLMKMERKLFPIPFLGTSLFLTARKPL